MPELRKDPIIGRWVIISRERARRPHDFAGSRETHTEDSCAFCEGHEAQTLPEIYSLRKPDTRPNAAGWDVRVIPNPDAIMQIKGQMGRHGKGMYDLMNASVGRVLVHAHTWIRPRPRTWSGTCR